jgi:hypothetical protein
MDVEGMSMTNPRFSDDGSYDTEISDSGKKVKVTENNRFSIPIPSHFVGVSQNFL